MLKNTFVVIFLATFCLAKEVTFKNVEIRGLSLFREAFKKKVVSSETLKDVLPETKHDAIEIKNQTIPVLYEDSLANLEELDELVIEHCKVAEIQPGALKNVPFLRKLSLKGNMLEHIRAGVFNNLKLMSLDLRDNRIETIDCEAFDNMPELLNIKLSDNKISKWNTDWFKNTPQLTRVSMQNNQIQELPSRSFKNFVGEKRFGKVDLTISFVFSHNKIEKIDREAFAGLTKINNLWLDNNLLTTFDEHLLEDVEEVDDLRIDHNNIKCLEGDLAKILKTNSIHMDSNPFDCDCLNKIKTWLKENNKSSYLFYSEMECSIQRMKKKMKAIKERLAEIKTH